MRKALWLLLFLPAIAFAQGLKDEAAVRELADKAMALVAKDDIKGAIGVLEPHWPVPKAEIDSIAGETIEGRKLVPARFGKPIGVQFIAQKEVAGTLLLLTYLEKYENHALRWRFRFYKATTDWHLNALHWDDQIGAMLE